MFDTTPVFLALSGQGLAVLGTIAVGVSLGVCGLMVGLYRKWGWGGDCHMGDKPQRSHTRSVSRLGGVGVFWGIFVALLVTDGSFTLGWQILICALPVFLVGFLEDITGRVTSRCRLGVACVAALAGAMWMGAVLRLPFGESWGVVHIGLSVIFTVFCVAGVTQSFNIIDGFNGLASGVGMIALAALGWLAFTFGDIALSAFCWCTAASVFGFFLWNYPKGKLFLGDGGAYLLGFVVAIVSVLLVERHSEMSWFLPLVIVVYPVTETLFSMWRRLSRSQPAGGADARHLHTLVHNRLNRCWRHSHQHETWRNSLTSTFFWAMTFATVLPGLIFWDQSMTLIGIATGFVVTYVWFYSRLVRFQVPSWMILVSGESRSQLEMGFVETLPKVNGHQVNGHQVAVKRSSIVDQVNIEQTEFWKDD